MKKKMLALLFAVCILVSTLLTSCGTSSSSSYECWSTDAPLKTNTLTSTEPQITRTPTPSATFTLLPTPSSESADLSRKIIVPTNTPEAVAATVVLTDPAIPPEVQNLLNPEYKAVYDQAHNWWVVTDRYGRGSQLFLTKDKIFVKMKPGGLVKIDDTWYRYDRNIGELIEWDVWEPGYKLEFIGTVEGIEIPITLGLMPDIMESSDNPILEIILNPDRPDAADSFAYYYLRQCWNNYNRENKLVSWNSYLDLVRSGEGKIKVPYNDHSVGSWNGAMLGEVKVAELSPTEGVSIFIPDTLHGSSRESMMNWNTNVVVMDKGKLTIINPIESWGKMSSFTQEERNLNFSFALSHPIEFVLLLRSIDEVFKNGSHMFGPSGKTSSYMKDYYKSQFDSSNNISPQQFSICQNRQRLWP